MRRLLVALAVALVLCPIGAAAVDAPPALGISGPQLLVDDHLIATQSGIVRVVQQPRKLGPILNWEGSRNAQPYVSVLRERGAFRLWYNAGWDGLQSAPGVLGHKLGFLQSRDGVRWDQSSHRYQATPPVAFGASVIRGPAGYVYAWWAADTPQWDNAGMRVATSRDGSSWTALRDGPVLTDIGDIVSIFHDAQRQRYVVMAKDDLDETRWVVTTTSRDLLRWTKPELIVRADERDLPGTQFYGIDGVVDRGGLLIGLLRVLNDHVADGIGYTTLVYSRDGKTWTRDRGVFLPRGTAPSAYDRAMAWGSDQVLDGQRVLIYYGAYQAGHKQARYGGRRIALASMPLDRYVARTAPRGGTLTTRLLRLPGRSLTINATGRVTVELFDPAGRELASCRAAGSGVARPVPCAAGRRGATRLAFVMGRGAKLYAFTAR